MSDSVDISRVAAPLFRALADPTRLALLAAIGEEEVPVLALAARVGEAQPKVSGHLAVLRAAGLVETRREHRSVLYRHADGGHVARILAEATELLETQGRLRPEVARSSEDADDDGPEPVGEPPARPPAATAGAGMHVFLRLGGERYALPARQVREALPYRSLRSVPSTLPALVGITTVRGALLDVFDLAAFLGVSSAPPGSIVIAVDRWGRTAGLAVEAVESIDEVTAHDIRPPQSDAPGIAALAFTPTGLALLLDADALVGLLHG